MALTGERTFTYTIGMSKYRLSKIIQAEINKLNEEIDLKIIRGLPYRHLARRHKFLVKQFEELKRRDTYRAEPPRARWFAKSLVSLSSVFL